MTGRKHIDWFARVRGDVDPAVTGRLVERFDVVLDRPVRELSTGNRQKIGLVLAFMAEPDVLVLDEPTSGLDPLMQREFGALVREAAAQGRTVFLSSHELDEVQRLADRVGIIRSGRMVAVDTVDGLRRTAPRRIEVQLRDHADPAALAAVPGVRVTGHRERLLTLEVAGEIGPALRAIADLDPEDLTVRHADLEELFLTFYRDAPAQEAPDAR